MIRVGFRGTTEERFLAKTCYVGDCIVWTGCTDRDGYGRFHLGPDKPKVLVHRYAWERDHGPIPNGLVVDHLCRVTRCINVAHLRICTHKENIFAPGSLAKWKRFSIRTTCEKGHPSVELTLYTRPSGGQEKRCDVCAARRTAVWRSGRSLLTIGGM